MKYAMSSLEKRWRHLIDIALELWNSESKCEIVTASTKLNYIILEPSLFIFLLNKP